MSINDTSLTIVGNLVADPDLKFVPTGRAVATVRVASTARYRDRVSGEWKDSDTLFVTCVIWGQQGEHVAESLLRGDEVIVRGRLKQRSYETRDGVRRTVVELEAEYIGPSLRKATAKITKVQRTGVPVAAHEPATATTVSSAPMPVTDVWSGAPVPAGAVHSPPF
jgi:single-strand DNA-binding protein